MNATITLLTKQLNELLTGIFWSKLGLGIMIGMGLTISIKHYNEFHYSIPALSITILLIIYAIKLPKLKKLSRNATIKEIDNFMGNLNKVMKYRLKYESVLATVGVILYIFYTLTGKGHNLYEKLLPSILLGVTVFVIGYFLFRNTMKRIKYYNTFLEEYKNTLVN